MLDDGPAVPAAVALLRGGTGGSRLRLTFTEGRKHEVKRYCEALGHPRRAPAPDRLRPARAGTLRVGRWRPLTPSEVGARCARVAASAR